jgi:hypothetical protein
LAVKNTANGLNGLQIKTHASIGAERLVHERLGGRMVRKWIGWQPKRNGSATHSTCWDLGDEPIDNRAVTLGIKLWEKYRGSMTKVQFQNELADYIESLAHHEPSTEPVDYGTARAFPYPIGFFNNMGSIYKGPAYKGPTFPRQ